MYGNYIALCLVVYSRHSKSDSCSHLKAGSDSSFQGFKKAESKYSCVSRENALESGGFSLTSSCTRQLLPLSLHFMQRSVSQFLQVARKAGKQCPRISGDDTYLRKQQICHCDRHNFIVIGLGWITDEAHSSVPSVSLECILDRVFLGLEESKFVWPRIMYCFSGTNGMKSGGGGLLLRESECRSAANWSVSTL